MLCAVKQINACWLEAQDRMYLTTAAVCLSLPACEPCKICERSMPHYCDDLINLLLHDEN